MLVLLFSLWIAPFTLASCHTLCLSSISPSQTLYRVQKCSKTIATLCAGFVVALNSPGSSMSGQVSSSLGPSTALPYLSSRATLTVMQDFEPSIPSSPGCRPCHRGPSSRYTSPGPHPVWGWAGRRDDFEEDMNLWVAAIYFLRGCG